MSRLAEIEAYLTAPVQVRVAWDRTISEAPPPITTVECVGHNQMSMAALELLDFAKEAIYAYGLWVDKDPLFCARNLPRFGEHVEDLTEDADAP